MGPQLEALAQGYDDLVVFKVDIVKWGSPVTTQFNIQSIPYVEVYDTKGELLHQGKAARDYLDRLGAKLDKRKNVNRP